jgi:glycosyltransferase involved in cell wall biosynthesis
MKIRIEGPYYGSYSLSQVNRSLIIALAKMDTVDVSYSATSAEDYHRDRIQENELESLAHYLDVRSNFVPDVVIRHTWPVESSELKGKNNYRLFHWEETAIDVDIVMQLNNSYDAVLAPSNFVAEVLRYNNIQRVIRTKNAACTNLEKITKGDGPKNIITYCHISSCFARKAPDLLIDCYCHAFKNYKDTQLIIKTGYNPHVNVKKMIFDAKVKYGEIADSIIHIDNELDQNSLAEIVRCSDYQVYPSRGEGFGLPVLEAHIAGIPCIMTVSTALGELYLKDIDVAVESKPSYASSHLSLLGSIWWEPEYWSLEEAFSRTREEYFFEPHKYQNRLSLLNTFRWPSWVDIAEDLVLAVTPLLIEETALFETKKTNFADRQLDITTISTYNTVCGIAEYTNELLDALNDTYTGGPIETSIILSSNGVPIAMPRNKYHVKIAWDNWGDYKPLLLELPLNGCVLIQHHSAFFSTETLGDIIRTSLSRGNMCIVEFHSALDDSHAPGSYNELIHRFGTQSGVLFLVHSRREFIYLDPMFTMKKNLRIAPLPFRDVSALCELRPTGNSYVICSFGFLRTHKGFDVLINAFACLRELGVNAKLLLITAKTSDPDSDLTFNYLSSLVESYGLKGNVTFITDYLDIDSVHGVLGYVDCVVFPYQDVPEGASAAVRVAISAGAAVICSAQASMFDELTSHVLRFHNVNELCELMRSLVSDRNLREEYRKRSKSLARSYSMEKHATYLINSFRAISYHHKESGDDDHAIF